MENIWKEIPGYEGIYEVSCNGEVKSLSRKIRKLNHKSIFLIQTKEKILKPEIVWNNRLRVVLCRDKSKKRVQIHRIVALTFIPNPENKPCINHIDGNPQNNNYKNLEWCNSKENAQHAVRTGLWKQIKKLNDKQIEEIRIQKSSSSKTYNQLAIDFNVSISTIYNVIHHKAGY
jgi:hypothetical protein